MSSPIAAYRWEHTDRALADQLALEKAGYPATVEQGHAAIRYVNPTTGGDVMPTIRAEFHRLERDVTHPHQPRGRLQRLPGLRGRPAPSSSTAPSTRVEKGDMVVVPSWVPFSIAADDGLDLFRFGDHPIIERLALQPHPGG